MPTNCAKFAELTQEVSLETMEQFLRAMIVGDIPFNQWWDSQYISAGSSAIYGDDINRGIHYILKNIQAHIQQMKIIPIFTDFPTKQISPHQEEHRRYQLIQFLIQENVMLSVDPNLPVHLQTDPKKRQTDNGYTCLYIKDHCPVKREDTWQRFHTVILGHNLEQYGMTRSQLQDDIKWAMTEPMDETPASHFFQRWASGVLNPFYFKGFENLVIFQKCKQDGLSTEQLIDVSWRSRNGFPNCNRILCIRPSTSANSYGLQRYEIDPHSDRPVKWENINLPFDKVVQLKNIINNP